MWVLLYKLFNFFFSRQSPMKFFLLCSIDHRILSLNINGVCREILIDFNRNFRRFVNDHFAWIIWYTLTFMLEIISFITLIVLTHLLSQIYWWMKVFVCYTDLYKFIILMKMSGYVAKFLLKLASGYTFWFVQESIVLS